MAAWKLLAPGVALGVISAVLLSVAMATDYWYVVDASLHSQFCPERGVFEEAIPWPYYAFGSFYTPGNSPIRDVEVEEKGGFPPAPLHGSGVVDGRGSRPTRTLTDVLGPYSRDLRKLREWRKLMEQLHGNLRSFGGRDITARPEKRRTGHITGANNTTGEVPLASCRLRQFSTASGLWRTCFISQAGSLLEKLIDCGNLTRCAAVTYANVDFRSMPVSIRINETAKFYEDELILLNVRRTVASFFFLSLVAQLVGLLVIVYGWIRDECFEQYAGGLVLLMSGIFLLAGLCTHIIQCRIELDRSPRRVYTLPSLVLHRYGSSAYAGWSSFGSVLLSSFLCIMAPLHPQRQPTPKSNGVGEQCSKYTNRSSTIPTSSTQPTPTPRPKKQTPAVTGFHRNGGGSVKVTPIVRPVAKQRSMRGEVVSPKRRRDPIEPWDSPSHFNIYGADRMLCEVTRGGSLQTEATTLPHLKHQRAIRRQMSDLAKVSVGENKESLQGFYRRTRSLPRDASSSNFPCSIRSGSSTIARCARSNYHDRTMASNSRDESGLDSLLARAACESGESDMRKVAEIFRSANRLARSSEDTDGEEMTETAVNREKWDSMKRSYLVTSFEEGKRRLSSTGVS